MHQTDTHASSLHPSAVVRWLWMLVLSLSIVVQGSVLPRTIQSADGTAVAADNSALSFQLRDHQRHGFMATDVNQASHSDGEPQDLLLQLLSGLLPAIALLLSSIAIASWLSGRFRYSLAIPRAPPVR